MSLSVSYSDSDLTRINPELEEILKSQGPRGSLNPSIPATVARKAAAAASPPKHLDPSVIEKDHKITMRDGDEITARVYCLASSRGYEDAKQVEGKPVFVVYHGGGYVFGTLDSESTLCRQYVKEFDGIAVNIDYRLAPEHDFPGPINDCYDALKWVAENMETIGGDASKGFIIGGISAGAKTSVVLSHLWRDEKRTPPLTGTYLSMPAICHEDVIPEEYKSSLPVSAAAVATKDPFLTPATKEFFLVNHHEDPVSPLCSPLLFSTGHANLPKAYIQICGMDLLRHQHFLYEQILRENGIKTKVDVFPGLPHGFWAYFPGASFVVDHEKKASAGLKWLLEK